MPIGINEDLISVREAAMECGRNMETIRRWIWAGKLPAEKLGNQLFISKSDLNTFRRKLNMSRKETTSKPDFLQRAILLQNKIRARTRTEFDIAALLGELRGKRLA